MVGLPPAPGVCDAVNTVNQLPNGVSFDRSTGKPGVHGNDIGAVASENVP